jgi:hypothetical protein
MSNVINNAGDDYLCHIALLFTAIVVHGSVPHSFTTSTIIPIPKGHNANQSDSANFRGIALSSLYCKIFDNIILVRYCDRLMTSELQFGFKAKHSTNLCSMVLKETISYYKQHQSPVFCTFLDATKAFDRLHYCKLFKLLLKRQLPVHILRVLINLYTNSSVRVAWGGITSDYFSVANGVKQGAVLSPVLFCVYIDDLLILLTKSGFGCYIGTYFVGALAYADDIVLVAPTATALRQLLAICESYAEEYRICFNTSKTKCLVVIPSCRRALTAYFQSCVFYVANQPIEFINSFSHLGHLFTSEFCDDEDIIKGRSTFIRQTNNTLCYFRKLHSFVLHRLFHAYCTSMYGCELWLLSNHNIECLCVAWRKSLRRIWKLPTCTHTRLLPLVSHCLPLFDEICRRSLNFIRTCVLHDSDLISFVARFGVFYARGMSILGQNALFCTQRYDQSLHYVFNNPVDGLINSFVFNSIDYDSHIAANILTESIMLRDHVFWFSNGFSLSHDELDDIINYICLS